METQSYRKYAYTKSRSEKTDTCAHNCINTKTQSLSHNLSLVRGTYLWYKLDTVTGGEWKYLQGKTQGERWEKKGRKDGACRRRERIKKI